MEGEAKAEPTGRGGAMGTLAGGGARGIHIGCAELETGRTEFTQHRGVREVEGLKGTSRGGADGLAEFGRGGGRGRLGNSRDTGDFELGETSGDTGDFELSGTCGAGRTRKASTSISSKI